MGAIFTIIISFLVQALALKLALGVLGQPSTQNRYGTALGVAGGLTAMGFVLGFVPIMGWLLFPVMWIAVVMGVYKIGFLKSLGVAILQVVLRMVISLILAVIGIKTASAGVFFF
ncbi:MAG: hypothetical protein ACNA8W_25775 [Bradymonadaceae bacterium]